MIPAFWLAFLGALGLSSALTPALARLARVVGLVHGPSERSVHGDEIPRLGGVAILASAAIVAVAMVLLGVVSAEDLLAGETSWLMAFGAVGLVFLVGLVDDVYRVRAATKFVVQLFAALMIHFSGLSLDRVALTREWEIDLGPWSVFVTVLWIIAITNSINLIDGLDGLAAGIAVSGCVVLGVTGLATDNLFLVIGMALLGGSLGGFLFFNAHPASIFMGDCGSQTLGFLLACGAIHGMSRPGGVVAPLLLLVALGVPVLDTGFAVVRRFLHRRSVFSPDREHVHHRLLESGHSHRWVVSVLCGVSLAVAVIAAGSGFLAADRQGWVLLTLAVLLILGFRATGVVRLREGVSLVRDHWLLRLEVARDRRHFEYARLRLRNARSLNEWWNVVCATAEALEFSSVRLILPKREGAPRELFWDRAEAHEDGENSVRLSLPLKDRRKNRILSMDVKVPVQHSLEAAVRRSALLGRLIDSFPLVDSLPREDGRRERT